MYTVQHLARADRPVTQRRREIFSVADANDGALQRGGGGQEAARGCLC
jgi:hypothetical protein